MDDTLFALWKTGMISAVCAEDTASIRKIHPKATSKFGFQPPPIVMLVKSNARTHDHVWVSFDITSSSDHGVGNIYVSQTKIIAERFRMWHESLPNYIKMSKPMKYQVLPTEE